MTQIDGWKSSLWRRRRRGRRRKMEMKKNGFKHNHTKNHTKLSHAKNNTYVCVLIYEKNKIKMHPWRDANLKKINKEVIHRLL